MVSDFAHARLGAVADAAYDDAPALSLGRRSFSYRQLSEAKVRLAGALTGRGVGAGDRVLLALPNCPQFVVALLATGHCGAVAVLANPALSEPELAALATETGAVVAICLESSLPAFAAPAESGRVRHVIVADLADYYPSSRRQASRLRRAVSKRSAPPPSADDPVQAWRDVVATPASVDRAEVAPGELAVVIATAGTTGPPRLARLTQGGLAAAAELPGVLTGGRGESVLGVLPMFHVYGLQLLLAALRARTRVVLLSSYDAETVLRTLETERVTVVPVVPPMLRSLIESPAVRRHDLRGVRLTLSLGMPLPTLVRERAERITSGDVVEGYGLTETSGLVLVDGRPLPGVTVRVVAPDGTLRIVEPGEPGEVAVDGPQVFDGYWGEDPRIRGLRPSGWLLTGDIAVETDGAIRIIERKVDVIGAGDDAVYPSEVEQVLLALPAIEDCCVVPHGKRRGRATVKAIVVPRPAASPDPDGVRSHAADRLPSRSVPAVVEYVESLPRSLLGVARRNDLLPSAGSQGEDSGAASLRRLRRDSPK